MVAIAVLGILVTFGAPGMQQLINGQRASSSANELLAGLALSRTEAIKRNTTIQFCVHETNRLWKMQLSGSDPANDGPDIRRGDLSNNINLVSDNTKTVGSHNCIDFGSDGLPYVDGDLVPRNDPVSLTVTAGQSPSVITKSVMVSTGSIYVD